MSKRSISKSSKTDWARLDRMRDEDIDYSDAPKWTAEDFAKSFVRRGTQDTPTKEQITLRIDSDVLEWFRAQGKGYQTHINLLLRSYVSERMAAEKGGRRR